VPVNGDGNTFCKKHNNHPPLAPCKWHIYIHSEQVTSRIPARRNERDAQRASPAQSFPLASPTTTNNNSDTKIARPSPFDEFNNKPMIQWLKVMMEPTTVKMLCIFM